MKPKSNILNTLGMIVTLVAIVFIIKKLMELQIDYSMLMNWRNISFLILLSAGCGINMFLLCIPWKVFVEMISKSSVPFEEASWIINKSNLMKYIPGNVFQYIGRNELAIRLSLSQVDVSLATIWDIIAVVLANFLLAVILSVNGVMKWYAEFGISSFKWIFIILGIFLAAFIVLTVVRKKQTLSYIKDHFFRIFREKHAVPTLVGCLLFDLISALFVGGLFALTLYKIVGADLGPAALSTVVGAYALSWVAGFIVPGAPGGIGIREASITLLLSGLAPVKELLLAAVVYRLITIIGDFIGFFLSFACLKIKERKGTARE